MLEKDLERRLVRLVEQYGGRCRKWVSPGFNGAPDRVCLLPGGHAVFVELKRANGKISPVQQYWHDEMTRLGFLHFFLIGEDGLRKLEEFFRAWASEGFRE